MRFYHPSVSAPLRIRSLQRKHCDLLTDTSDAATGLLLDASAAGCTDRQALGPVKYPRAGASRPHQSTELSVILRDCHTPSQVRPNQQ